MASRSTRKILAGSPETCGQQQLGYADHPRPRITVYKVEMGGIEPPSDGGATGLLRVQFVHDFLSPGVSREQGRRRAQSPKSPEIPDDEGPRQLAFAGSVHMPPATTAG